MKQVRSRHHVQMSLVCQSMSQKSVNVTYHHSPGRPPGATEKKERMGADGGCLPGTYPAQNEIKIEKSMRFKR